MYYPKCDCLLKTSNVPLRDLQGEAQNQEMMGCFTFFLIINHQFNRVFSQYLSEKITVKCGWKDALKPNTYLLFLKPQRRRKTDTIDENKNCKKAKILVGDFSNPAF